MIVWPITQHRTEYSAGGTGALADACLDSRAIVSGSIGETSVIVNAAAPRLQRSNLRVLACVAIAACAATLGWLPTRLLAALPAGACLALLAASDLATHRFSLRALGSGSALVVLALAADSELNHTWERLAVAAIGAALVSMLLVLAWLWASGLAFGDVLLVVFTVVVPLYVSTTAAAVTLVAALIAAAVYVGARAAWLGRARSAVVPLAPALLAGWLCGMVAA